MALLEAMNRRKTGQDRAVKIAPPPQPPMSEGVLILEVEPSPVVAEPVQLTLAEQPLRPGRPGEVGMVDTPKYPDVPYSEAELRTLLTNLGRASTFMLDNLGTPKGNDRIGLFCDLAEATHLMMIAHMAHGIFEAP